MKTSSPPNEKLPRAGTSPLKSASDFASETFPIPVAKEIWPASTARLKLTVRGVVQGVGFRPFVYRLAQELGLAGWINNSLQGVFIEVEGATEALNQFIVRLGAEKPPHSFIQSLETSWLDTVGHHHFEIRPSATDGAKSALILPDIATCPDCLHDILDPASRRFHYPFTNCTHCGPRFSIVESLPYDRANTTMKSFIMCPQCQAEYDDPLDRRFHAQPNACPACGPHLELWNPAGDALFANRQAMLAAAHAIRRGRVVAVKGIGGFHLLADARNETAVQRLRVRKHRERKPFALMLSTLASVQSVCEVSPLEARLLCSPAAPIVILQRHQGQGFAGRELQVAPGAAPGNPNLGVMLPATPLHHLLMAALNFPLIATSGNLSDEPLCTDEHEALNRLDGIADLFLVHNRPIIRPVDDSIVRVMLDRELVLRRARGYAPLPIMLNHKVAFPDARPILAVGAHLKNTVALAVGGEVFLSQHLGDLGSQPADHAFYHAITDLEKTHATHPEIAANDLHPDYRSTKFADALKVSQHIGVQHHAAHVLACLADNEVAPPALGVAWDGTGYGPDGTIWGGEFFRVTQKSCERVAHLRPFRLPGGDNAVTEPRRAAVGLLWQMGGDDVFRQTNLKPVAAFSNAERSALKTMLKKEINSPLASSMGRFFDAVGSLIGLRQVTGFEGQAAMELEFALDGVKTEAAYRLPLIKGSPLLVLDWAPMVEMILADLVNGVSIGIISAKFHNALAEATVEVAGACGLNRVALSGGCFQNRYLTERVVRRLRAEQFLPCWHQRVPPNDGGIALGQVVAAYRAQTHDQLP